MGRVLHGSDKINLFLAGSIALAYLIGLFVPLMDADAAHHANIALHMYLQNDYVHLVDKGNDYLDKPHLLFWLAAMSYQVLGVSAFSYKIASLLFSIAGAFATYRLGTLLYNTQTGKLAAFILVSAQAFILACMDVKMDALLTANIILATWQLIETVIYKKWYNLVLAALFMALGFATKGQIGLVMPGVALFFFLLYKRDFRQMFHIRWLALLALVVLFISPVLYCYYLQFDLHPTKTIRGMSGISGVKFILWGQNIERLDGGNWGGGKRDYFFYLHTMLWAFLPWSLLAYYATGMKIKALWKDRFRYIPGEEALTAGTIVTVFTLISLSKFQLPHYLNILFPFFAILTAVCLLQLHSRQKWRTLRIMRNIHVPVIVTAVILVALLCSYAFPVQSYLSWILAGAVMITGFLFYKRAELLRQLLITNMAGIAVINILLNGNFYPALMQYQAGYTLAKTVQQQAIPNGQVAFYNTHSFVFDFATAYLHPAAEAEELRAGKQQWLVTDAAGIDSLRSGGITLTVVDSAAQYRVTRLKASFLNPATRPNTLDTIYLIKTE